MRHVIISISHTVHRLSLLLGLRVRVEPVATREKEKEKNYGYTQAKKKRYLLLTAELFALHERCQ